MSASASDARKLLTAIAQAKKAAIALHENGDDELPGEVGDVILLFPNDTSTIASETFLTRAALAFCAAERFQVGRPKPKISNRDMPRAKKLVAEMRSELRHCDEGVIGPPNAADLALKHAAQEHAERINA